MNNLITINKTQMPVVEYQGQRVVTFSMIDLVHARPEGTARAAFNRNREHFIEGVDFHELTADVIRTESLSSVFAPRTPKGLVLTETGYLMLTKPFNDDVAWQVQRELVNSYFRPPQTAISELEMIARIASHNAQQQRQLNRIDEKVEQMHEAVEQIKQGTIPAGWIGYSMAKTKSGLTIDKCKTLAKQYNIRKDQITILTPEGMPRPMAIIHEADFMAAMKHMMNEAENRGTRWYHPKMGLFQAIGWEEK
ncbi:ORF6N domain-containing protein [Providencia rettgeri]|nr:ORF6N domain-containing protein [Providencia rettgeri]HEM7189068.1 ORF6N domain-containing protein [Providencia rettgeri]